jgi:hypothetical protein
MFHTAEVFTPDISLGSASGLAVTGLGQIDSERRATAGATINGNLTTSHRDCDRQFSIISTRRKRSMTRMAECACGALKVKVEGEPLAVGLCSCIQCQKRTGSAISVSAYFLKDNVQPISGTYNTFVRPGDSGAKLTIYFCPTCGSSIFWEGGYSNPDFRGVAVGCFADPSFPPPQTFFFSSNKPSWLSLPAGTMLFETEPTQAEALALFAQLRGS